MSDAGSQKSDNDLPGIVSSMARGKFSRFAVIGACMMLIASALNGLLIDICGLPEAIIAPAVIILFFLLKYFAYVSWGVMERKFYRYVSVNIALTLFSAWLVPVAIRYSPLNAFFSTAAVLSLLVVVRFLIFRGTRLIR